MRNLGGIMSSPCVREVPWTENSRGSTERRKEPRHHCPKLVRIRPVTTPESSFRLSLLQNVSASGIGLVLTNPLEPGTMLEVVLDGRTVSPRRARVVHSTKQVGGWLVGCTLDHSLSDAELDRLLA
jgi:hypothetical protein